MSAPVGDSAVDQEIWPLLGGPVERTSVLSVSTGSGAVLGATRSGKPVSVRLLRPAAVRIVVVTHAWLASLLAIRAAALGATTVIATDRPAPWSTLVRAVGGQVPFAAVLPAATADLPEPTVAEPLFVLHDSGEAEPTRAPWRTTAHLVFGLTTQVAPLVEAADLILLPRPADEHLDATLELLRLPPAMAGKVAQMERTEVLAVTRSRALFVTVQASPTEKQILRTR